MLSDLKGRRKYRDRCQEEGRGIWSRVDGEQTKGAVGHERKESNRVSAGVMLHSTGTTV